MPPPRRRKIRWTSRPQRRTKCSAPKTAAALANALAVDPADTWTAAPARPLRLPSLSSAKGLDVSRADRPDGSSTVILKQPLPTEWDAKVGADLGLAATPSEVYQPGQPMPGLRESGGSGAAWASLGVLPNLATLDARVDPGSDQGRLGTTFKRSMPVGSRFSVTLQNSASITETFSALSAPAAGSADHGRAEFDGAADAAGLGQ